MASSSAASLGSGNSLKLAAAVRIPKSLPPPDEWTKVKELTMENRAPCEVSKTVSVGLARKPIINHNGSIRHKEP